MSGEHARQETTVVVTEALAGATVERWQSRLRDAAAGRPARLIVDLRHSPRMDAAAIVLLLQLHRELIRADARLTLRAPVAQVRRMPGPARVDHVLEVEEAR
ncbi:STAS domain-containing protein [Actinoplanes auranticolor]|uniref:STAS domain-containing protein n=1 Tax=Actinoplanes auranticolor TaxID=47988 RepID=UPI001BB344BA|nr:STAS domain-containing protein [Actinoplanes auranticolor]